MNTNSVPDAANSVPDAANSVPDAADLRAADEAFFAECFGWASNAIRLRPTGDGVSSGISLGIISVDIYGPAKDPGVGVSLIKDMPDFPSVEELLSASALLAALGCYVRGIEMAQDAATAMSDAEATSVSMSKAMALAYFQGFFGASIDQTGTTS